MQNAQRQALHPPLDRLLRQHHPLGTAAEKIEQAVWTQAFVNMTKARPYAIEHYTFGQFCQES